MNKERPILFSGEMVRAILEGRKTQIRRLNGLASINENPDQWRFDGFIRTDNLYAVFMSGQDVTKIKCPYGKPGDKLWVRETFCAFNDGNVFYKADNDERAPIKEWKPSIYMRREYSRIDLEITNIRVERLQDISDEDAKAEGIVFVDHGKDKWGQQAPGWNIKEKAEISQAYCLHAARFGFGNLWISINGDESWGRNPRVWVIEFRRIP